jgi:uncharacterized protein YecE (DUF72 family)
VANARLIVFVYDGRGDHAVPIRAGTCAFQDHEFFYPKSITQRERLKYYVKYFSVVEIDSTYYGFLREGTWERWLSMVPDNFIFHVKAHGAMTLHVQNVGREERLDVIRRFKADLEPVKERGQLGAILLQFPPWFRATSVNRILVERLVDLCSAFLVAIEFRERSWFRDDERRSRTIEWIAGLGAIHVICDEPQVENKCVPLVPSSTHSKYALIRMHGRNLAMWDRPDLQSSKQRFDYRYSKSELESLVPVVRKVAEEVEEVHILMNNNSNNDAVWNGFDWLELLDIPHLPRPEMVHSRQIPLL